MRLRPFWIVLAIFTLPLILVAAGWLALPGTEMAGRCSSVAHIMPTESDAVAFSTAFRSAILDNPGGSFRLHATDVELTSYVALNTQGRQLADPQIHFLNNTICFSGRIVGLGLLTPQFRIEARPYVADGNIQFDIRYLIANGRVLPVWIRRLTQRITNESIQDAKLPVRLGVVQMHDGEIVVAGERLPDIGY